jgi:RimJ/RimL family protein N-acetyltransferase
VSDPVIRLRHAVEDDATALGEAHGSAWEAAYGHIFEPAFLKPAADSRRLLWRQVINDLLVLPSFVLVAEIDGAVLGFANGAPADDGTPRGEIRGFYSSPAAWGTGSATLLMDEACSILAATFDEVVLWTLRDAYRARSFYEKSGFRVTGHERQQTLTNWLTGEGSTRTAVEYAKAGLKVT